MKFYQFHNGPVPSHGKASDPVSNLRLTIRIGNLLHTEGPDLGFDLFTATIADIMAIPDARLRRIPFFGDVSVRYLRDEIDRYLQPPPAQ